MGEFTHSNGRGKCFVFAVGDIFTGTNFIIALVCALVGYAALEFLRKKL